jgi:predicted Zn-dependent protease
MRTIISSLILISLALFVTEWVWASEQEEIAAVVSTLKAPIPQEVLRAAQFLDQKREQNWGKDVSQERPSEMTRVNEIVRRLGGARWTARILDGPEVNAFTVGGPYFYIYPPIFAYLQTNDALALMIAHEMSHVLLKHGYQRQHANLAQLERDIAKQGEQNTDRQEGKDMTMHAGKIATAAFTRDQEEQADALATILCLQHGFDPEQGKEFFFLLMFQQEVPKALGDAWLRGLKELTRPEDCLFISQAECQQRAQARQNIEGQQRQRREAEWFNDHPRNPNRALAITALTRHLRGNGSLDEVRKYHQTYIVLEAYRAIQAEKKGQQKGQTDQEGQQDCRTTGTCPEWMQKYLR